jgi:hypothetical protein
MSHAMLEAVILRHLTANKMVNFKPSPCGICGEQSDTERFFFTYSRFPLVCVISAVLQIHSSLTDVTESHQVTASLNNQR